MNNKWMKYISVLFLAFTVVAFYPVKPCYAASAEVEITSDKSEVTVGDNIMVFVTITSDTTFGDFEANLSYDDSILEYDAGASVITGGSGFLKISDTDLTEGDISRKYTLQFKAIKSGIAEVAFSGRAMVFDYDTSSPMSVSSNVLSLNVKAPKTASENANLKSLKISPSILSPNFDKNVHEYSTSVGYETQQLIINAITEDSKAKVSISGNDFLKEGENKVIVTVLAESGAVIEYTINVTREAAPKDGSTTDNPDAANQGQHGSFEAIQVNGETYVIYSGKYQIIEPNSEVKIPEGYVKSSTILSDISVTVFYPANNPASDFLLIYAINESGEEGFYQYDRVEKTMQRYIPAEVSAPTVTTAPASQETTQPSQYRSNLGKAAIVIALLSGFCALLIVVLIRLYMKLRGFKDDEL